MRNGMALDAVDLALVEALREDGRASYEALGAKSGVSRTAARARVQRLLEEGVVEIEAIIHPAVEGIHTFAHVSIATDGGSAPDVAARLAEFERTPLVSLVAGRWSLIAELRTADIGEMKVALGEVRDIPGVVSIDTTLYVDIVKDSHLPLGGTHSFESFHLDETDHRLLMLLREDPRIPYADMAERVGLSRGATRARVLRLLKDSVVAVSGMINATTMGFTQMCGLQVHLEDNGKAATESIAALPEVDFLALTLGRSDLIGTIIAESRQDVHRTLDTIRTFPGVRTVEAWYHLDLIKEWYEPRP
jgi:DNA-binding Lrp family transcriptional regulator